MKTLKFISSLVLMTLFCHKSVACVVFISPDTYVVDNSGCMSQPERKDQNNKELLQKK